MRRELQDYEKIRNVGDYFTELYAYNNGQGSVRLYYTNHDDFVRRLNKVHNDIHKSGHWVYRISEREKFDEFLGLYFRRVYFTKK